MRQRTLSEHAEQSLVISWFDLQYRNSPIAGRLFAVPNGGHRHIAVAGKLKAEGVRRGVPDLHLPFASRGFVGLVIEMKSAKGAQTEEQKDWLSWYGSQRWLAKCCRGSQEAIETIRAYVGEMRRDGLTSEHGRDAALLVLGS